MNPGYRMSSRTPSVQAWVQTGSRAVEEAAEEEANFVAYRPYISAVRKLFSAQCLMENTLLCPAQKASGFMTQTGSVSSAVS